MDDILRALDERILDALKAKATGETIAFLCEARAWLTNPDQSHGTHRPTN